MGLTTSETPVREDRGSGTLLSLASALARTDSVEDVALAVRDVMHADLGASFVSVSLVDGPWLLTPALGQLDDDTEQRWLRLPLDLDTPAHRVARAGRRLVFDSLASLVAMFPHGRDAFERARLRSGAVLPMTISDGYRIGSVTFAWDVDRTLTEDEVVLVTAVTDATAQAARRAQLYRERRDVAHTLQAAMLPELPALPGLAVASRYLPWSTTDEQVGVTGTTRSPRRTTGSCWSSATSRATTPRRRPGWDGCGRCSGPWRWTGRRNRRPRWSAASTTSCPRSGTRPWRR